MSCFLRAHWEVIAAADMFTVKIWQGRSLVRYQREWGGMTPRRTSLVRLLYFDTLVVTAAQLVPTFPVRFLDRLVRCVDVQQVVRLFELFFAFELRFRLVL